MPLYTENQKFANWAKLILLAVMIACLYPIIETYNTPGFWVTLWPLILLILISVLFNYANLNTQIDETGISIKFFPFHRTPKKFLWAEMQSCTVRKYNSIVEYGGWGIRYGINGKAYNTRGNMGIQIKLKNGKEILIGTQKPVEVENILKNYFK